MDVAFGPYGENWRLKKKLCGNQLLSPPRVQSFRRLREDEVAHMVSKIRGLSETTGRGGVNLSEVVIRTSNDIVCRCALGGKYNGEGGGERKIGEVARKVMIHLGAFSVGDYFPGLGWADVATGLMGRLRAISGELDEFFDGVIEKRKAELEMMEGEDGHDHDDDDDDDASSDGTRNLLDILLKLQQDGFLEFDFTRNDLKSIIIVSLSLSLYIYIYICYFLNYTEKYVTYLLTF